MISAHFLKKPLREACLSVPIPSCGSTALGLRRDLACLSLLLDWCFWVDLCCLNDQFFCLFFRGGYEMLIARQTGHSSKDSCIALELHSWPLWIWMNLLLLFKCNLDWLNPKIKPEIVKSFQKRTKNCSLNLVTFRCLCSPHEFLKRNSQNMHVLNRTSLVFCTVAVQFVYVEWMKKNIAAYLKTNNKPHFPVTAITFLCGHTK